MPPCTRGPKIKQAPCFIRTPARLPVLLSVKLEVREVGNKIREVRNSPCTVLLLDLVAANVPNVPTFRTFGTRNDALDLVRNETATL